MPRVFLFWTVTIRQHCWHGSPLALKLSLFLTVTRGSPPALLDILEKSVRELACIRHAASSGVSIQTNDRVSQSEEASYSIPKAFLGKLLTHQFEPGISKRDRTGLELRKSFLLIALGISGKESIVTKRVAPQSAKNRSGTLCPCLFGSLCGPEWVQLSRLVELLADYG